MKKPNIMFVYIYRCCLRVPSIMSILDLKKVSLSTLFSKTSTSPIYSICTNFWICLNSPLNVHTLTIMGFSSGSKLFFVRAPKQNGLNIKLPNLDQFPSSKMRARVMFFANQFLNVTCHYSITSLKCWCPPKTLLLRTSLSTTTPAPQRGFSKAVDAEAAMAVAAASEW